MLHVRLLLLSAAIGFGSFIAGNIPIALNLFLLSLTRCRSAEGLNVVNTYAAGLLVGTALIIIIPEGADSLYQIAPDAGKKYGYELGHGDSFYDKSQRSSIGISLALGFVIMFLIDAVASGPIHGHKMIPQSQSSPASIDMEDLNSSPAHSTFRKKSFSAVIGLIIHSAADGLALGAAGHSSIQWIIFLALIFHKAPAAFGLSTFLIKEGQSRKQVRGALFVFSIAAPIGNPKITKAALLTSIFLDMTNFEGTSAAIYWSGIVLLFSGGTFLYVSTVHILPEIYINSGTHLTRAQIVLLILGVFSPALLSIGHIH